MTLIYYGLHRLLGQEPIGESWSSRSLTSLIGTTIAGTFIYFLLRELCRPKGRDRRKREMFTPRRQTRRRNPIRLSK